jgi:N-acyl-D-amino-acid deacylase
VTKTYDVVFVNATVADGSGDSPRVADVAVAGDRIEFIGNFQGESSRYIDVFGKVLAPGFVDFHSHSDYSLLLDPFAHSKLYQGVTTEVGGNCGYHAAPVFGQVVSERRNEYGRFLDPSWNTFDDYVRTWEHIRPTVNYAQQIGYNTLRSSVTADHARPLSAAERDQLQKLVADLMKQGCAGLSYGVAYAPACFSSSDELADVAKVTADHGGVISFHMRNEDATLIESIEETLAIGFESGARTHIGHLKTFRRPNWSKIDRVMELLADAKSRGMHLTVDRYPYLAMNTQLKFALPTWTLAGGVEAMKQRLRDPETRRKIVEELNAKNGDEAREVMIALVGKSENRKHEGCFLDDIAGGRDPWDVVCELLAVEGDSAFATFFGMSRENLDRILSLDYCMVASDASVQAIDQQAGGGRPHPRCFDTFPYFLAEWVFARRIFDLGEGIRKMTSAPAEAAGLTERGRIAEGYFADLVVFEPEALSTTTSYENPMRFPEGIETVMVNGSLVLDQGQPTGVRPGRFLRKRS